MRISRWSSAVAAMAALLVGVRAAPLAAQGNTTGAVTGIVTDAASGAPVEAVQIQVVNTATGVTRGSLTRGDGRYTVLGLEPSDRYSVTARRIGFRAETRENQIVSLSQATTVNFQLTAQAATLSAVTITGVTTGSLISPTRTGATTTITDSALRRLPTLNRDFTDFATLSPQVGAAPGGGLSGAGSNNRFNNIQIDGATEADVFGLGSTGQPGAAARAKSISIESVKEYQVLISPYDVRQGNFAGTLINAVTKSGTNRLEGSAYYFGRNEDIARSQLYIPTYQQQQYGFSVGGPIIKNRAFFFLNPEIQRRTEPAEGLFLGGPGTTLSQTDVDRFITQTEARGLSNLGTAGLVNNETPLTNVYGRLDVNLGNTALILSYNYAKSERDIFSRGSSGSSPLFPLSNNGYINRPIKQAPKLQLRTNFSNGAYNELLTSYNRVREKRVTPIRAPQVEVAVSGGLLSAGTERSSQGNELDQDIIEVTDNFTFPLGAHRLTVGTQNQFIKFRNLFTQQSYGRWEFTNLDSLERGRPSRYSVGVPIVVRDGQVKLEGDGAVRFSSAQYAGYIQDQWTATERLTLTAGFRIDVPVFFDEPPLNERVLADFGRDTREIPSGNPQYSPRVGFNWDVTGDQRNQLRGGIGSFVGRPAYVWLSNAFQNSGVSGVAQLQCPNNEAPDFTSANAATPPTQCLAVGTAPARTAAAGSEINLLSDDLKFPQNLRATLGYDRNLFRNIVGSIELLYTRGLNNPFYENIALAGPIGRDRNGRVVYGDSANFPALRVAGRSQVLDVRNQSKDYSYSATTGLTKRFENRWEGSLFYTFTRAMEVQGLTSSTAFSQYRFGRATGGDLNELNLTPGRFDRPHRIVAQASYAFPTNTDLSFIYTGQSGARYEYVSSGDLNGDGFTLNDPIYVPRNVYDPSEIQFATTTPTAANGLPTAGQQILNQQVALERFIQSTPCLRDQRGRIMTRNSCTAPWSNILNVSLRQAIPTLGRQRVTVGLDIFNFLNLLNKEWGELRENDLLGPVTLLTYAGKVQAPAGQPPTTFRSGAQNLHRFDLNIRRFNQNRLESNYQMQLWGRYSF